MFVNLGTGYPVQGQAPSGFSDYTGRILQEAERRRAGLSGRESRSGWSDTNRRRLFDKIKQERAAQGLKELADDKRREQCWRTKAARDKLLPPINRPSDVLYDTAIHEAGHAVQSCLEGAVPAYATVVPTSCGKDNYEGHVQPGPVYLGGNAGIRFSMAGPIAAAFWHDRKWTPGTFGDGYDYESIEARCDGNSVRFHELKCEVEKSIKRHWPVVAAVADLLVKNRTVLGWEIRELVKAHISELSDAQ